MSESYYNMYDCLTIKYSDNRNAFIQKSVLFKKDYYYFLEKSNNPDIVIDIGKFNSEKQGYLIENNQFLVNNHYFLGRKKYKVTKFQYSITLENDNKININLDPNIFANRVIHQLLLDFIINLMLFNKGYSNLHCSGLEKNGCTTLITGPGGAGKTSFSFYCLNKGYKLLGDDRIFLKNGIAHSFPECPGIEYNNSCYLNKYLTHKAKFIVNINKLAKTLFFNYVGMLFSMRFFDVFPKEILANNSNVKSIVFLQPSNSFSVKKNE